MTDWISVTDAARMIGYSRKQILRLIAAGSLKAEKFVTLWRVDRHSLLAYKAMREKVGAKRGPKPAD